MRVVYYWGTNNARREPQKGVTMNEKNEVRGGVWHRLRGQARVLVRGRRGREAVACRDRREACMVLRAIGPMEFSQATSRETVIEILAAIRRGIVARETAAIRATRSGAVMS